MASLAKVLGCLQHDEIPGQLHFTKLNPRISLAGTRLVIPSTPQPWPRAARRLAGVSSFGFGGTNAHIIVEEAPARSRPEGLPSRPCHILTLSARTESAVKNLASRYEKHLAEHPEDGLADICFSANAGRSHFARRVAVVVESKEQLREALAAFAAGLPAESSGAGAARRAFHEKRRPAHCLSVWRGGFERLRRVPALRHPTRVSLGDGSLLAFSRFAPG